MLRPGPCAPLVLRVNATLTPRRCVLSADRAPGFRLRRCYGGQVLVCLNDRLDSRLLARRLLNLPPVRRAGTG